MQPRDTPTWAERLVRFLDDGLTFPGTSIRFGADAILGLLFPVAGDAVSALSALSLFWLAIERHVPWLVLVRMLVNVGTDALVGSIPLLGDLFDVAFKANRRNLELIERYGDAGDEEPGAREIALVTFVGALLLALFSIPFLLMLALWRALD
jgi:hypothetical protein